MEVIHFKKRIAVVIGQTICCILKELTALNRHLQVIKSYLQSG